MLELHPSLRAARDRRQLWLRLCLAIGIALTAIGTNAGRAAADDIVAVYAVYWAGLPAGHIRLTLRDSTRGYSDKIDIATEGLPYLLTRFRATATAEGRVAQDKSTEPSRYSANYDLHKRRDSRISMQFIRGIGGVLAERGPDDTSHKPLLPERYRYDAIDPLSALERIRQALRATKPGGRFTVPVYDGARRFDVVGQVLPKQQAPAGALRAELTLRPIAGFKGETSEDGDPNDAPRKVQLSISDDARMVPLSITVPVYFMSLIVQFQRLCAAPDPCS